MDLDSTRLRGLAVSDSGFVFDPLTGHTFTVNCTAHLALRCLKDGLGPEETARHLAEEFDTDSDTDPIRDVQDFVSQLRDCGLLK